MYIQDRPDEGGVVDGRDGLLEVRLLDGEVSEGLDELLEVRLFDGEVSDGLDDLLEPQIDSQGTPSLSPSSRLLPLLNDLIASSQVRKLEQVCEEARWTPDAIIRTTINKSVALLGAIDGIISPQITT